jgi:hypothetical protein
MDLRLLRALGLVCGVVGFGSGGGTNEDVASLVRKSAEANSALVRAISR